MQSFDTLPVRFHKINNLNKLFVIYDIYCLIHIFDDITSFQGNFSSFGFLSSFLVRVSLEVVQQNPTHSIVSYFSFTLLQYISEIYVVIISAVISCHYILL